MGFEPTQAITPLTVFKTVPLNHLGTPPKNMKLLSLQNKNGGGGGIRTHAGCYTPDGFQDRSLKPLGYTSKAHIQFANNHLARHDL